MMLQSKNPKAKLKSKTQVLACLQLDGLSSQLMIFAITIIIVIITVNTLINVIVDDIIFLILASTMAPRGGSRISACCQLVDAQDLFLVAISDTWQLCQRRQFDAHEAQLISAAITSSCEPVALGVDPEMRVMGPPLIGQALSHLAARQRRTVIWI